MTAHASAKKKGGKLSKADKEKLQKEEDERKLKEEEEVRLLAQKEEQERLERQRVDQKLQQKLELKDSERREDELSELRHLLEENQTATSKWEAEYKGKAKWERYMRCDGSPDPTVQQEINTFIKLWRGDPQVDILPVLKQCALTLQLIKELESLLMDSPDPADAQRYQETLASLQELIYSKQQLSTEEILKTANAHSDIETGNMQTVIKDENITMCLWANLNKNPRFKGFHFKEAGLGFELPKQLAVSDIAVRILHTRYDHLSHLARRAQEAQLLSLAPSHRSVGAGEKAVLEAESSARDTGEGEGEAEGAGSQQHGGVTEDEVHSVKGSDGRKSAVSVLSARSGQKHVDEKESQIIETLTEENPPSGEGDPEPATVVPEIDMFGGGQVVDLQQYTPLGGIFYWDVVRLPPQAQQLRGWEMRKLLDTGLQVFPYPIEQSQVHGSGSGKLEDTGALASPPVGVSVGLPDAVLFLEHPHVARWDPTGQQWRTDCISDISYHAEEKRISFKMDAFYIFTLLQDTYINVPFQSWKLQPLGQDSTIFTIDAAQLDISITIKGNQCMLQLDQDRGLSHLVGRWMRPKDLQRAMVSVGLNIFFNQYSDTYVTTNSKDPGTEHTAYEQMALLSSAYAFSWSQWNTKCGAEYLVLQVCEHSSAAPINKDAWSVYLLGSQRSQKLKIKEQSPAFSPELYPGSEFHSTFLHMLRDGMSHEGQEISQASHHLYVDTVQTLLSATRPFNYC
ncbi:dynein axonemal intermediate chain 7 [Aplochiton taeniatus]